MCLFSLSSYERDDTEKDEYEKESLEGRLLQFSDILKLNHFKELKASTELSF